MGYREMLKEEGLIEYPFTDLSGGLNTKASRALGSPESVFGLKYNQLIKLRNWEFEDSGGLVKRKGYTKFLTTGLGAGKTLHTIYEFVPKSGTRYIIVGYLNNLYVYNSGTDVLDLAFVAEGSTPWVFTTFEDLAVGVNGVDVPIWFNGTLWGVLEWFTPAAGGTVSKSVGSPTITGVGTDFVTDLVVGDKVIVVPASGVREILEILTIDSITQLTMTTNATIAESGEAYRAWRTGPPVGAVTIAEHRNRLWAVKDLSLHHCALNAPNDWTTVSDAGTLPIPIEGKSSAGTFLISLYDRLIIGLDASLAVLTGTSPDVSLLTGNEHLYRLDPLNAYQGGIRQQAVLKAVDDVHYLSRRGVHSLESTEAQALFGDVKQAYLSAIIEPTFQETNFGSLDTMFSVNLRSKNQSMWIRPIGAASTNSEALVYDYYHGAWTTFDPFPFASGAEVRVGDEDVLLFGGYDGELYQYGGVNNDDGSAIVAELSYLTALEDITLIKDFRHFLAILGASANTTYTIQPYFDYGAKAGLPQAPQVTGGEVVLPLTLPFVLADVTSDNQLLTIPIPGRGTYVEIRVLHSELDKVAAFRGGTIYAEPRRSIHA